jgi:hypothetical protein
VHDNNDGKDGRKKNVERKGEMEKLSCGGQRDDVIRKNYFLQDSREIFFVIFFPFLLQRNYVEIEFERSSSCSNNFRKEWLYPTTSTCKLIRCEWVKRENC